MKTNFLLARRIVCASIRVLCPAVFLFLSSGSFAADLSGAALQDEDCGKCHKMQLTILAEWGGKHSTEVGCLDCHPQHPPEGEYTLSPCSLCHEDKPHFQITDCRQCHADPHRPISSLQDPAKPTREECLTCHADVGQQMKEAASRHATLYCTHCHQRHEYIPSCLDCHEPHLALQTDAACLSCHPAHQPLLVAPTGWVPAIFCQACHLKEAHDLASTMTNHGPINCIYCHEGPHPSTPTCQHCHGLPHDMALHGKFRRCLNDCHGDAHRLVSNPVR